MSFFGSDSGGVNGQHGNPCGDNFYVGKIGDLVTGSTANFFNSTLANSVMAAGGKVYGYWFLHGTLDAAYKTYATAFDYGKAQGQAAANYRMTLQRNGILNTNTTFGDVEQSATWDNTDHTNNQQIINGFLSAVLFPGLYSSPCQWEAITGSAQWQPTSPNGAPVLWTSSRSSSTDTSCPPSWTDVFNGTCGDLTKAAQGFAGGRPTIWQYVVDFVDTDGNKYDYDMAGSLPQ